MTDIGHFAAMFSQVSVLFVPAKQDGNTRSARVVSHNIKKKFFSQNVRNIIMIAGFCVCWGERCFWIVCNNKVDAIPLAHGKNSRYVFGSMYIQQVTATPVVSCI